MTSHGARLPWSVPVRRDDVPEQGRHFELIADEQTRAAIAALAGIRALPRLAASFEVTRQGAGLRVTGEVRATVGQTCVVTLEPLDVEVSEPIDLAFVATRAPDAANAAESLDPEAADDAELMSDGVADLGAVATEFLLLAIDPYPRKPGAVFEPPNTDDRGTHPFAALAALKKKDHEQ